MPLFLHHYHIAKREKFARTKTEKVGCCSLPAFCTFKKKSTLFLSSLFHGEDHQYYKCCRIRDLKSFLFDIKFQNKIHFCCRRIFCTTNPPVKRPTAADPLSLVQSNPGHSSADSTWQTRAIHPEPHGLLCPTGFVIQFDWVMPWAPGLELRILLGFAGEVGCRDTGTHRRREV